MRLGGDESRSDSALSGPMSPRFPRRPAHLAWEGIRRALAVSKGQRIGRYEVTGIRGDGGMGAVHEGHDPGFAPPVTITDRNAHFQRDPDVGERFDCEAILHAELHHPGIVTGRPAVGIMSRREAGFTGSPTVFPVIAATDGPQKGRCDRPRWRTRWNEPAPLAMRRGDLRKWAAATSWLVAATVAPATILLATLFASLVPNALSVEASAGPSGPKNTFCWAPPAFVGLFLLAAVPDFARVFFSIDRNLVARVGGPRVG